MCSPHLTNVPGVHKVARSASHQLALAGVAVLVDLTLAGVDRADSAWKALIVWAHARVVLREDALGAECGGSGVGAARMAKLPVNAAVRPGDPVAMARLVVPGRRRRASQRRLEAVKAERRGPDACGEFARPRVSCCTALALESPNARRSRQQRTMQPAHIPNALVGLAAVPNTMQRGQHRGCQRRSPLVVVACAARTARRAAHLQASPLRHAATSSLPNTNHSSRRPNRHTRTLI
jgi:hypothetical protein